MLCIAHFLYNEGVAGFDESNPPSTCLAQTNMRLSQLVMNNQKSSSHLELFRAIAFGIRR